MPKWMKNALASSRPKMRTEQFEAAAQRFHVPHAKRHKIIVMKIADQGERKTAQ